MYGWMYRVFCGPMALFCKSTYLTHKIREKQVLCQNFIRFLFFCSHFSDIFRIFAFAIGKLTTQKSKNECKNKYLMAKIIVRNQTKKHTYQRWCWLHLHYRYSKAEEYHWAQKCGKELVAFQKHLGVLRTLRAVEQP